MNTTDILPIPENYSKEDFFIGAKALSSIGESHDELQLKDYIRQHYPVYLKIRELKIDAVNFNQEKAEFIVARAYGFENSDLFLNFLEELNQDYSETHQFENAADAIVNGELDLLRKLIQSNPALVNARSQRLHHATLLHYVSANGVEDFRQRTPENAVAIANVLLKAGAEVDAVLSDKESTTLGLAATSIHPYLAGVQIELLDTLLKAGAARDGIPGGWQIIPAALANGSPEAARYLILYGTDLYELITKSPDKIELIKDDLKKYTILESTENIKIAEAALMLAAEYGNNSIIEFILQLGVDQNSTEYTGLAALHWAAAGGKTDTIKFLLKNGASLEKENIYDGTPLNQALWWPLNGKPVENYVEVIKTLIEAGAKIESDTKKWVENEDAISIEIKTELNKLLDQ